MNSLNHYSYGSVGEWLFSGVAGIDYDESIPGFRKIRMRPIFSAELQWCKASYTRARPDLTESRWLFK